VTVINSLDDLNIYHRINDLNSAQSFRMEVRSVYVDILLLFH